LCGRWSSFSARRTLLKRCAVERSGRHKPPAPATGPAAPVAGAGGLCLPRYPFANAL